MENIMLNLACMARADKRLCISCFLLMFRKVNALYKCFSLQRCHTTCNMKNRFASADNLSLDLNWYDKLLWGASKWKKRGVLGWNWLPFMDSYFVAASSKEATNTSVPSWSGRRNFNRSEISAKEHQVSHVLWFIACHYHALWCEICILC